jgi:hypothetical protein
MKLRSLGTVVVLRGAALAVLAQPLALAAQVVPGALTPEEEKVADMRMPELDRSGLLPTLRKPIEVEAGERNPFAVATKALERMTGVVTDTGRDRIEKLLRAVRVSGVSESPGGRRVLLGPFSLAEGQELPRLFADQVDRVRVKTIAEKEVVLEFIESDPSKSGSPLSLPIGLDSGPATVRSLLVGEVFRSVVPLDEDGEVALPALQSAGAQAVLEGAESQDLQGLVSRPSELLDAPAEISSNEGEER